MNANDKHPLHEWFVRAVLLIILTVIVGLVNRYLGVRVEVPPPPPVTVVIEPQPGGAEPKVTVTRQP